MYEGPIDVPQIHEAWCSCSDCSIARRRDFRGDLRIIGFGASCALIATVAIYLLGFGA